MNGIFLYGITGNASLWLLIILGLVIAAVSICLRQRRRLGEALEALEMRNQILVSLGNMTASCVIILDKKGDICHVNRAVERYYGKPASQIVGKNIQRFHTDFSAAEHRNTMKVNFDLGISYNTSVLFYTADGKTIPFDVEIQRFTFKERHYYGIVAQDTQWLKTRERHIREQEERLGEIEAIADMGYWEINHQTGEVFWSRQLYHILGCEINAVKPNLDMLFSQVHPEDQSRVIKAFTAAFQNQATVDISHRLVRQDGEVIAVIVRIRHTFSRKNEHLSTIGLVQKITGDKTALNFRETDQQQADSITGVKEAAYGV